jgi:SAM-dependent methyltransferase
MYHRSEIEKSMSKKQLRKAYQQALWRIYNRPEIPELWVDGGNLPWDDPDFSQRMLREHLDESHGAASRVTKERQLLVDKMWAWLELEKGNNLLDMTCGPGLYAVEFAKRGCQVTGVDFGPASIAHAKNHAREMNVSHACRFIESDVRSVNLEPESFDAATFIYGQLSVFAPQDCKSLLSKISQALRPGGYLCVEFLNQENLDKKNSSWWFTDDKGLWGDEPFLHLGERFWLEEQQMSVERFQILNLDSGGLSRITLCDQSYSANSMVELMQESGFESVAVFPAWDGLPLYDAEEWIVYIGQTPS